MPKIRDRTGNAAAQALPTTRNASTRTSETDRTSSLKPLGTPSTPPSGSVVSSRQTCLSPPLSELFGTFALIKWKEILTRLPEAA